MIHRFAGCTSVAEEAVEEVAGEWRQHAVRVLCLVGACMLFLVEVSMQGKREQIANG